jgi:hypothetical protein
LFVFSWVFAYAALVLRRFAPFPLVLLFLILAACGSTSMASSAPKTTLDIRGTWDEVAVVGPAQYPQTLTIITEDMQSGTWKGTDVSPNGQAFTVTGTISGSDVTSKTTDGSYVSNAKGKIDHTTASWRMAGTFTDSGHLSGTYTAMRVIMLP